MSCAYVVVAGHATILAVDCLPMVAGRRDEAPRNKIPRTEWLVGSEWIRLGENWREGGARSRLWWAAADQDLREGEGDLEMGIWDRGAREWVEQRRLGGGGRAPPEGGGRRAQEWWEEAGGSDLDWI